MSKQLLLLSFIAFSFLTFAQPCLNGRYASDIFQNVTVTSDVQYGSNTDSQGAAQNLILDIYEPTGDTSVARPLIIWAHGGSFLFGSKTDGDMVELANSFAKKGYVCASIDYRLGFFPFDSINAIQAVVRAVHDMNASIRFFYKDKATINAYNIDTTKIYVAGSSAGAITSLHVAYLDKDCELETIMSPTDITAMGGLKGMSGNPGYSTQVAGVISLAGALFNYGWIESGDVPLCSTHGTADGTVKYNRGQVNPGIALTYLDGSRMLHEQANAIGLQNSFYSHYGADHVPHASSAAYMDTTINFARDFLIDLMGCTEPALQPENTPLETAFLYPLNFCGLSIAENNSEDIISIFPNPSKDKIQIEFADATSKEIILMDTFGRKVRTYSSTSTLLSIEMGELKSGNYFVVILSKDRKTTQKIVFL